MAWGIGGGGLGVDDGREVELSATLEAGAGGRAGGETGISSVKEYPFAVVACAGIEGFMSAAERLPFPEKRKAKTKAPASRNRISRPAGF